jgi:lysozyme
MNTFWRWFLLLSIGLVVVLVFGYVLVSKGVFSLNNPDPKVFNIRGVDVSHHQGNVDWKLVKAEGVDFAFIKATEGGDHRDNNFISNWKKAQKEGIVVGGYHYYSFCKSPEEQFVNLSNFIPKQNGTMPPAIDLEYDNNCNGSVDVKVLRAELSVVIKKVKAFYGKYPILYCNEDFYDKYLAIPEFSNCTFWIRGTYKQPKLSDGLDYDFWQFNAKGSMNGIKGFVDLNVYCKSREAFEELLN